MTWIAAYAGTSLDAYFRTNDTSAFFLRVQCSCRNCDFSGCPVRTAFGFPNTLTKSHFGRKSHEMGEGWGSRRAGISLHPL